MLYLRASSTNNQDIIAISIVHSGLISDPSPSWTARKEVYYYHHHHHYHYHYYYYYYYYYYY
jgi:hypothetical protein